MPIEQRQLRERIHCPMHAPYRRLLQCLGALLVWGTLSSLILAAPPTPQELLKDSRRVLFLGDSITASGQYVAYFEAWLLTQPGDQKPQIIDAGLPSETVSGLSEEGHAGGKFP